MIDIIGLTLNVIFFRDNSLFIETDILYGAAILINVVFLSLGKKMNLYEDYYDDIEIEKNENENKEGQLFKNEN